MSSPQTLANCHNRSTPLLVSKNILIRDSIFKRLDLQNDYSCSDKAKESQMYQQLERKMEAAQQQHVAFMQAIEEKIAVMSGQAQNEKASLHQKKIDMWELRNEVMQLQEMIEQDQCQLEECEQYEEGEEGEYEQGEAQIVQSDGEASFQQEEGGRPRDLNELLSSWGVQRPTHASVI